MAAAGAPHSSPPDPSPTKPKRRVFLPPCRSHRPIGPPPPPPTSSSGLHLQPRSRLSPFVPHPSPPPPMAPRKARVSSRNPDLIRGIGKFSRSKMYHKRGIWAIKAKNGGVLPRHDAAPAAPKPEEKAPKFYPADDVKQPIANRRKARPTKLRASISPGTVLILLAGRFMGKRVVFLKQLTSGLLHCYWTLIIGKEIHCYSLKSEAISDVMIGTTLVDMYSKSGMLNLAHRHFMRMDNKNVVTWNSMISGCASNGCLDKALELFQQLRLEDVGPDAATWNLMINRFSQQGNGVEAFKFFAMMRMEGTYPSFKSLKKWYLVQACKSAVPACFLCSLHVQSSQPYKTKSNKKKTEGEFFEADEKERNDDQKVMDSEVVKAIEAVPDLKTYLGARFSLRSGMKPHELVF